MIRRLVEQQQIRSGEQQAAECNAPALSAGERLDVALALGHAQRVHRVIDGDIELPGVGAVDRVLHLRLLGEQDVVVRVGLRESRRDLVEAVEEVAQRAHAVLHVAAHVSLRVEPRLLLEEPHACPWSELGNTGRWLLLAGHDPQDGRLAGPVRAEHTNLRAREERQGDVRQHLALRAVELIDPVHRVDVFAAQLFLAPIGG